MYISFSFPPLVPHYKKIKMEIIINGQRKEVSGNLSLEELLKEELNGNYRGIAVALNKHVVPREQWKEKLLKHQDEILIIKATQGG
jgi:thiamine biosynthesis protein ThiS